MSTGRINRRAAGGGSAIHKLAGRVAAVIVVMCTVSSYGATYTWNNAGGGTFQAPGNWSPNSGFPGSGDAALFGNPTGAYTVNSTGNITNAGLQASKGSVTLALTSGQTYSVTGTNGFQLGTVIGQGANLTLTGGTLSLTNPNGAGAAGVGLVAGAGANLAITGVGTSLLASSSLDVGINGAGNLTINNGATATIGASTLGYSSGALGTLVSGAGSTATLGNTSAFTYLGLSGIGAIEASSGGLINTYALWLSYNSGSSGIIYTDSGGTVNLNYDTRVGNGIGTEGQVHANFGGNLNANTSVVFNTGGTGYVDGNWHQNSGVVNVSGGSFNINSGGSFTSTNIGTGINVSSGDLHISGGNSTVLALTRSGSGAVILSDGSLTVSGTYNNGNSSVSVDGNIPGDAPTLTLFGATTSGMTNVTVGNSNHGTLNVYGGAILNASSFNLGGLSGSTGTMSVLGSNSKVQLTGGNESEVGGAGAGTLSILSGGSVNTGNGDLRVATSSGSTGTIDVSGGSTLNLGEGGLVLGDRGAASMLIRFGGAVTQTGFAYVGLRSGGFGFVTLTGEGSSWSNDYLYVGGVGGSGTMTVNAGATVTTTTSGSVGAPVLGSNSGSTGYVSLNGGTWNTASLYIGDSGGQASGQVYVNSGGTLNVSDDLRVFTGGTLEIGGGTVNMGVLSNNGDGLGGRIYWSSGAINVTSSMLMDNTTFGTGVSLGSSHTLTVGNILSVPVGQVLTINGASVSAGTLIDSAEPTNWGSINLQSGSLTLTNSDLTIGTGGRLGSSLTLANGANLRVTGAGKTLSVSASGVLNLTGGTATGTSITNAGEIDFASPVATLGASGQSFTNTGRVVGTGRVNANLVNNANGRISVDAGQRLVFAGSTNNNNLNGTIEMTGGTVEFAGTLTNAAGGMISGRGTFRGSYANTSGTGLSNSGAVAFSGGTSDVYGKVQNIGGSTGGQIINSAAGTLIFHDDVTHNGKEIRTVAGSRTVFLGAESGTGSFTGTGTVEMNGDLRPGNSPATVTFGGDLDLEGSATLHIEIGGTARGTQYDVVQVAGQLSVGGALAISLISPFTPALGSTFDILDWGSFTGQFSAVTLPALPGGLGWNTSQLYSGGVLSVGVGGDYNANGAVEAGDYVLWRKGGPLQNEVDLPGTVNAADYTAWRARFGNTSGSGTALSGGSEAVPEPAAIGLLSIAMGAALMRSRGRRQLNR